MSTAIRLIVGLGNPGPQYETTRHNAGAWFVEQLAHQCHVTLRAEHKFLGHSAKIHIEHHECHLLIPSTFMNRSGAAVAAIAKFYKISLAEMLIAHDELDLAPGTVKLKQGGGHAGHNGLRDIIAAMGSNDFLRLRLGIGHPGNQAKVADYVLSQPGKTEQQHIMQAIDNSLRIMPDLLQGKIAAAIKTLHTKEEIK
ncbi:MAG: aminoacyl-tRNA hydrolase [Gammaproteobacteria bacterium]